MDNIDDVSNTEVAPSVRNWHRHATSPEWVKSLFLNAEHYSSSRNSFEIVSSSVKEAFTYGTSEQEFFVSMLVKSGARSPLEVDFCCGRFHRKNVPGNIVFGGGQTGSQLKGVGPFESIALYFPKDVVAKQFQELTGELMPDFAALHSQVIRDDSLRFCITQLLLECRRGPSPGHQLITDGLFQSLIGRIATLSGNAVSQPGAREKMPAPAVSRALEFMREHLADSIGIDEIAQAAGVHKGHFNRLFKQTLGQSPMRYMSELRIKKAKELLHRDHPRQTIREIAQQCGFCDTAHFSNEFKRQTGQSPTDFLRA